MQTHDAHEQGPIVKIIIGMTLSLDKIGCVVLFDAHASMSPQVAWTPRPIILGLVVCRRTSGDQQIPEYHVKNDYHHHHHSVHIRTHHHKWGSNTMFEHTICIKSL